VGDAFRVSHFLGEDTDSQGQGGIEDYRNLRGAKESEGRTKIGWEQKEDERTHRNSGGAYQAWLLSKAIRGVSSKRGGRGAVVRRRRQVGHLRIFRGTYI